MVVEEGKGANGPHKATALHQACVHVRDRLRDHLPLTFFGFDVIVPLRGHTHTHTRARAHTHTYKKINPPLTNLGADNSDNDEVELCVVDINYYPSYRGVPDLPARLASLVLARWAEHTTSAPAQ